MRTHLIAFALAAGLTLAINAAGGSSGGLPGWGAIDEVRLSSVKRYGASGFTPPTAPFTKDAGTVLLAHLDGSGALA